MQTPDPLPPILSPSPLAERTRRARHGRLSASDDRARQRAQAALSGAARLALAGAVAAGVFARTASPAAAEPMATFTVINLSDHGAGSLRAAVDAANLTTAVDNIVFASTLTGTITLTTGEINILSAMNIIGPGPSRLTIDANAVTQVLFVGDNSTYNAPLDVTISGLTITGGNTYLGGGVYNFDENLTLNNVVITANDGIDGGGIYQLWGSGSLTLLNSTISENRADYGGGISMPEGGKLIIRDSVITGNTAYVDGGGINAYLYSPGPAAVIERSTISDNQASGSGGGALFGAYGMPLTIRQTTISGNSAAVGGGLFLYYNSQVLTIENSTISGNTASDIGGGVYIGYNSSSGGTISVRNTTIAANSAGTSNGGGGFYFEGNDLSQPTIGILNSILADNTANAIKNDLANGSTGTHNRFNLRYTLVEAPGTAKFINTAGNKLNVDPLLGVLANNGGRTFTHMPAANSPAVNAGDPVYAPPPGIDQRGGSRVLGGRLDMGATERGYTVRLPFLIRSGASLLLNGIPALVMRLFNPRL